MQKLPAILSLGAALLLGALTVFAFAPYRLYLFIFVSLFGLLWLCQQKPTWAGRLGYLWGISAYTSQFYWIYYSLHDIAKLPAPAAAFSTVLLPAYLAVYPALACYFSFKLTSNKIARYLVLFPAFWTLGEWLRGWLFTGFSWGEIGYSQITESPLAGLDPILGIHGVSFAIALIIGLLMLSLSLKTKQRWLYLGLILPIFGLGQWGKAQAWTEATGKPFTVALAQGNIPQELKWSPAAYRETLERYYQMIATARADLIVLPETALPVFAEDLPEGMIAMLQRLSKVKKMDIVTGIPKYTPDKTGYLNAVIDLVHPNAPYYAKDHLVPFGEFVPFPNWTGWIYNYMNMPLSGFTRGGHNQAPLNLAGQKIAFNICYEDGFGDELIDEAKASTVLANVSNLAWFGHSNAMSQHLQIAQARSLEFGRETIRSTNTGMTATILADGEIGSIAAPNTEQVLYASVQGYTGETPYMRYASWPILLYSCMSVLCTILISFIRKPQS